MTSFSTVPYTLNALFAAARTLVDSRPTILFSCTGNQLTSVWKLSETAEFHIHPVHTTFLRRNRIACNAERHISHSNSVCHTLVLYQDE